MFSTRIRKSGSTPVQHKEGAFFQPKLTINAPGDQYEQEADTMAERVVQQPQGKGPASVAETPGSVQRQEKEPEETPVQRKCADCEQKEKERLQRQENKEEEQLQRQAEREEEPVQTKPLMRKNAGGGYSATPALSTQLSASKGQGTTLPAPTRTHMETAFGADFGQVRIHTDSRAADMNAGVNARAFTHGSDIYFNRGQYAPESGEGRRLLAHELTHVVQQGNKFIIQRNAKLPDAIVVTPIAEIYADMSLDSKRQDVLYKNTELISILEKKKSGNAWWYKVQYKKGKKIIEGWTTSENVTELAQPDKFKFQTPGTTGNFSPFEKLREAVSDNKLDPHIARLINMMNIVILPQNPTLPSFVNQSFYPALVASKGNFKKATLLITAAVRSFKQSGPGGNFPWVQSRNQKAANFDPATFRDKIWHFFWNAYERFDGTGETWLDIKGIAYELKSRPNPIKKLFTLTKLDQDATEDVLFNRGGVMYADWVLKNKNDVYKYHTEVVIKKIINEFDKFPELANLSMHERIQLIVKTMINEKVGNEILKNAYLDFADYAGQAIDLVLSSIKK